MFSLGALSAPVLALNQVSFKLERGETLGIVGESGSGKSTLARTLIGLETASGGSAVYRGHDLVARTADGLKQIQRQIQMVFQDPTASLNPRMDVKEIICEPWAIHDGVCPRHEWDTRARDLLEQVGLQRDHGDRYPHQFSGGQRQRIAIARALALKPEIIIFDEAVSSLDVSVQAQVIELLKALRKTYNLSYLFIAHDLPVVRSFADRVLVMHKGVIVEQGTSREIFDNPQHEYTRELLQSDPALNVHVTAVA